MTSRPSSSSSAASSVVAITGAPLRLAISIVSPTWSGWPWVSRIVVGLSSSALTAACGLPVMNGSMSTVASPSVSVNAACPRKRMSMGSVLLVGFGVLRFAPTLERALQLEPDGDADEHPELGLLGHERADRPQPGLRVALADRLLN